MLDTTVSGNVDDLGLKESIKMHLNNGFKATIQDLMKKYGSELTNINIEFGEIDGFIFNYSAIHKSKNSSVNTTPVDKSKEPNSQTSKPNITPKAKAGAWLNGITKSISNLVEKLDCADDMLPYHDQIRKDYLANNLDHLTECAQVVIKKINRQKI